ncbi:MAG TPA: hypothetical protein VK034_16945 [Enhygromyxa sp.]|nr:hypothetical protein [Enhygromyxa sp.]
MEPVGDDALAVTEPRATKMLARPWRLALLVLLVPALAWTLRSPIGTRIVARQLEAAETAEQQAAALCRMNEWSRSGHAANYGLRTLDADGVEFRPWLDGDYDRVATLIIEWTNGSTTTIELLGHDGLDCAFHG